MSDNPVTCGNCQTENAPGSDFCSNCGEPLTRSAEEEIAESQAAQNTGSLLTAPPEEPGGVTRRHVPGTDSTVKDGLPTD